MLLLVEDNAADADLVDEFLHETGDDQYDLKCVGRVSEALSVLRDADLDIVLLDLGLPDTQGTQGVEAIRNVRHDMPIVVLTGNRDEALAVACLSAGANDYLMKGEIAPQSLRRAIGYAIARQSLAAAREREQKAELDRIDRMRRFAESLVEANPDAVLLADQENVVRFANVAAETLFGATRDALIGESLAIPVDLDQVRAFDIVRGDETLTAEIHAAPVEWENLPMTLVAVRDLTERRAIEEQLRQAQKMETLGQLTGGVAHDFNNLLTVILGNSELLVDWLPAGGNERALAETMLQASLRGAALTSKLLSVSRRRPLDPKAVDIAETVNGVEELLRRTLGDDIDVEIRNRSPLPTVLIDRAQLETALLNLAVNARDAMPHGGLLSIETATASLDADYAARNADVVPGTYVVLAVSDTGTGMTEDVAARAFEAFFTTKEVGRGTGLGLSMVHGFVEQSGGHISLYSAVGQGTTIRLFLPLAGTSEKAEPAVPTSETPVGDETVLVVEDEDMVRDYVVGQLSFLGYAVHSARDASAALTMLDEGLRVDLLFTDVVMTGGIGGRELAAMAAARLPDLRVLFTSGYAENAIIHGGRLDPGVQLLPKPYDRHTLATKIRTALDGPPFAA